MPIAALRSVRGRLHEQPVGVLYGNGLSRGKSGRVVDRDDGDLVYVKFDDGSYGELPEEQNPEGSAAAEQNRLINEILPSGLVFPSLSNVP